MPTGRIDFGGEEKNLLDVLAAWRPGGPFIVAAFYAFVLLGIAFIGTDGFWLALAIILVPVPITLLLAWFYASLRRRGTDSRKPTT